MKSLNIRPAVPSLTARRCRWVLSVGVCAAVLTGCTDTGGPAQGPPSPSATAPPAAASSTASPPTGGETTGTSTPGDDGWGIYKSRDEACGGVTSNLLEISLLPTSLALGAGEESVQQMEDRLEELRLSVPPELAADFAWMQLLMDSFGEDLAASGNTAGPAGTAEFDREAFDTAVDSVKSWLDDTCVSPDAG